MPLAEPTTYRHGDTTGLKDRLAQLPLKVSEEDEKTGAGNYFVANYPPFSFWKPEHTSALDKVLATEPDPDTPLGLYFHIPFCRKRCHFCYFRVYTDKSSAEINGYIQAAMEEMERYAQTDYLKGRKPKFIYFGGGTPSYLSIDQLTELTSRMKAAFPLGRDRRSRLRSRARNAHRQKAQSDQRTRRHPSQHRCRKLR